MKEKKYTALLVSPDGDWVTDFEGETKEEVLEQLSDRGSTWLFYPIEFVVRNPMNPDGKILETGIPEFKNRRVGQVLEAFKVSHRILEEEDPEAGLDIAVSFAVKALTFKDKHRRWPRSIKEILNP